MIDNNDNMDRSESISLMGPLLIGEESKFRMELESMASERTTSRHISTLLKRGIFASEGSRGPLCIAFPADLVQHWMPDLFPRSVN